LGWRSTKEGKGASEIFKVITRTVSEVISETEKNAETEKNETCKEKINQMIS
jgi:hypothetical protein